MSKKAPIEAPADVVNALSELERASSPTHLGRAYKTVLDWRRTIPNPIQLWQILQVLLLGVVVLAAVVAPSFLHLELNDFTRGMFTGTWIAVMARSVSDWITQPRPVPTLLQRIDDAIGRWRHAVPAMRDFPK